VQDYWDRIIGTETTVKSVITFYINDPFFQPNNGSLRFLIAHALNTSTRLAA
jgi:hypothetical protein